MERAPVTEPPQASNAASPPQLPNLRRQPAFRDWIRFQSRDSRTVHLLENGFVSEAASSDDGIPADVMHAAAEAYSEVGWLAPAVRAFALTDDRESVRRIAVQWLDAGLLEEAAFALHEVALPLTDDLLDRYVDSCKRDGLLLHTAALELLAARAAALA